MATGTSEKLDDTLILGEDEERVTETTTEKRRTDKGRNDERERNRNQCR